MKSSASIAATVLVLALAGTASAASTDPFDHPVTARAALSALAPVLVDTRQARVISGSFEQAKYLPGFPQPLRSSGRFRLVRGVGVVWQQTAPFESRLVLSARQLSITQDGQRSERLSAEQQPGVKLAAQVFAALIALDLPRLAQDFDLYLAQDGSRWVLGLTPRLDVLKAVARRAVIRGDTAVESVELMGEGGQRTRIVLRDLRWSAASPSATDLAPFAAR